jgi:hypothetical protein
VEWTRNYGEKINIEDVENDEFVPKEWLRKKISNEDAEDDILIPEKVWSIMKQKIRLGDEIWGFSTPPWMWECLNGRAGLALVRKGEIVQSIVTEMN